MEAGSHHAVGTQVLSLVWIAWSLREAVHGQTPACKILSSSLSGREAAGAAIWWFWSTSLPGREGTRRQKTTQPRISLPNPDEAPQMALLMQQKLIFSQFCKLEVQDQTDDSSEFSGGLCLGLQMASLSSHPHMAFPLAYTLMSFCP